ncbi:Meiotic Sister-Chromatid recombination aldehyde dehydrogenase [Ceratobasidium sp. 395]|nr:Meiotic Sister-Chromatid recombination aldehyde dehydrogenase [Ceratobasidium sp. 395]
MSLPTAANMSSRIQPNLKIASRRWLMTELYDELRLARCQGRGGRLVKSVHSTSHWASLPSPTEHWREGTVTRQAVKILGRPVCLAFDFLSRTLPIKPGVIRLSKISTGLRNASPAPNAAETYSESSVVQHKPLDAVSTSVFWVHEFHCVFSPILAPLAAEDRTALECSQPIAQSCRLSPPYVTIIGPGETGRGVAHAIAIHLAPYKLGLGGQDMAVVLPGTEMSGWVSPWHLDVWDLRGQGRNSLPIA